MAEKHEIELVITPDGKVRIATRGLKGAACMTETQALEEAIGKVRSRTKTREYYEQVATAKTTTRANR